MTTNRRTFVIHSVVGAGALTAACVAQAQSKDKVVDNGTVDAKDPQAATLSYNFDTTKVDAKKFPKHTNEQRCGNCALYQGKAEDKAGGCPLFAGKKVNAAGWCSAYAAKAKG